LGYFDAVISSFDLGYPKEDQRFWETLRGQVPFDPVRTLLVDDNADVLATARAYGIHHLFFKAKSSSQQPAANHAHFPSIASFRELME
jgi:putative hydrolase of the HAD superfamily